MQAFSKGKTRLCAALLCAALLFTGCQSAAPAPAQAETPQKETALSPAPVELIAPDAAQTPDAPPSPAPTPEASPSPVPAVRSAYTALVEADPANARVDVELSLDYYNDTGDTLYALTLRLWPNAIAPGSVELTSLSQAGEDCYYSLSESDPSVLHIPLSRDLAPGGRVELGFAYSLQVPEAPGRFGVSERGMNLGHFLPAIPVYEAGLWRTDAYASLGDSFYSRAADYSVAVRCPITHTVAASGATAEAEILQEEAMYEGLFVAQPARDFALALVENAFPATAYSPQGVQVVAYAGQNKRAEFLAETAASALGFFESRLGPYPYAQFTAVATEISGGMEYPGLILVNYDDMDGQGTALGELYIAHEAAHQWFYNLVGSDQYGAPWVDEALVEFLSFDYIRSVHGETYAEQLWEHRFYGWRDRVVETRMDADMQSFAEAPEGDYVYGVYGRGSLLYKAVQEKLGTELFYATLREICDERRFKEIDGAALMEAFSRAAEEDLSPLFESYMEWQEAETGEAAAGAAEAAA